MYMFYTRLWIKNDIIMQSTTQGMLNGQYITPNVVFKEVL